MSVPVLASQVETPNVDPAQVRHMANFSPGVSADPFVAYASLDQDTKIEQHVEKLKEEVRAMLVAPVETITQKLDLIDDITRLGVSHHFEKEIHEILQKVLDNSYHCVDEDLNSVSLRFRLLRQQGYNISSDVFHKFKNSHGKFKESLVSDVVGLLSLYEAAHLMIHGEDILEEALAFTTTHLESAILVHRLSSVLLKQVSHALSRPFWKGLPRIEAMHYMSIYREVDSHSETLLTLAKLDFNQLQKFHQKEITEITRWWKDLDFVNKLPFARDRLLESYFWAFAAYFEPEYQVARIFTTKFVAIVTTVDDIYDAYGTYEELELFTEAIERWDMSAVDQLPGYMRVCYEALLNAYAECGEMLATKGNSYRIHYGIEAFKIQCRSYLQEAKWVKQKYTPTIDEYMEVKRDSSFYPFAVTTFLGVEDIVTKEAMDWVIKEPKIVKATAIIGRLLNDMVGHEFEQTREHSASSVECYMNQYGVTAEKANIELTKLVHDSWKDVNEEWISNTSIPKPLQLFVLNLARSGEVIYTNIDTFTHPKSALKGFLVSLFVEPVPM